MIERAPITTLAELAELDESEILEGYRDGYDGEPEPGDNRSLSYWHGWRNGAVDGGHREKDAAQAILVHEVVNFQKERGLVCSDSPSPGNGCCDNTERIGK